VTNYPDFTIKGMHTTDGKLVYAVGNSLGASNGYPVILRTLDGGTTWVEMPTTGLPSLSQGAQLSDVHVVSATEAYIVGHKRLTTKGYVWKFDGTECTEHFVGAVGSEHYSIYAPASNDIYIGDTGNEYRHGTAFSAFPTAGVIAGWDDYDTRTLIRGASATQVAVLGSWASGGATYYMRVARGSNGSGWTSDTLKNDFYQGLVFGNMKVLAVTTDGKTIVASRNRSSGNFEAAIYENEQWNYNVLGAENNVDSGVVLAGGDGTALVCYSKVTTGQITSWFYDGTLFTQNDTMQA
jgi:hypothetical protein